MRRQQGAEEDKSCHPSRILKSIHIVFAGKFSHFRTKVNISQDKGDCRVVSKVCCCLKVAYQYTLPEGLHHRVVKYCRRRSVSGTMGRGMVGGEMKYTPLWSSSQRGREGCIKARRDPAAKESCDWLSFQYYWSTLCSCASFPYGSVLLLQNRAIASSSWSCSFCILTKVRLGSGPAKEGKTF